MPTVGAKVIGSGTQLSPWRYELGAGTGNIPTFNLFSIVEPSESGNSHEITLGTGCLASIIKIKKHLHVEQILTYICLDSTSQLSMKTTSQQTSL